MSLYEAVNRITFSIWKFVNGRFTVYLKSYLLSKCPEVIFATIEGIWWIQALIRYLFTKIYVGTNENRLVVYIMSDSPFEVSVVICHSKCAHVDGSTMPMLMSSLGPDNLTIAPLHTGVFQHRLLFGFVCYQDFRWTWDEITCFPYYATDSNATHSCSYQSKSYTTSSEFSRVWFLVYYGEYMKLVSTNCIIHL